MKIAIAFGDPAAQTVFEIDVAEGTTLAGALADPALVSLLPDGGAAVVAKGVWGKVRPGEYSLRDGDRIELYRPLVADPKTARRKRAAR